MLETINGIDLLIAIIGVITTVVAYNRGRDTGVRTSAAAGRAASNVRVVARDERPYDHEKDGL